MAERSEQLLVEALERALDRPEGLPLHAGKKSAGLFTGSRAAKKAAQLCKEQGFLHTIAADAGSKADTEICAITDKGMAYLLRRNKTQAAFESLTQRALLKQLKGWQESRPLEDCRLPELFHTACTAIPSLTIGQFHDALRRLHESAQVYLHPWTGPMHALPEPDFALMVGHEIAYYASLRE